MGKSNRFSLVSNKPRPHAMIGLYLLPVLFGVVAVFAGGIAWHSPIIGLGMLAFVVAGYIAATALVASMIEATRTVEASAPQVASYPRLLRRV